MNPHENKTLFLKRMSLYRLIKKNLNCTQFQTVVLNNSVPQNHWHPNRIYVHDILDIDKKASPIFVGDMDFYVRNNEWTVMSFPARRNVAYYKCCPEPFPDVTFYLKIRRKPLFYILSVLFPCMLTSFVAILAFLLPPESGEKVSLNVTILLSLAVFLLMVSDQLPASSDHFPYVGEPTEI